MKRTIIALLSLSGTVLATDYTGTFSWGSGETPLTLSFGENSGLDITEIQSVTTAAVSNPNPGNTATKDTPDPLPEAVTATYKTTTYLPGTFTPDVNIGNGGTWTLSFTVQNNTTETLDIDRVSIGIFTFNGSGDSQSSNTDRPLTLTLGGDFTGSLSYTHSGSNSGSLTDKEFALSNKASVAVGDSVDFSLNVQEGVSLGTFVGLQTIKFSTSNVPEPTTATLSLLALAGLAARRRRK